MANAHTCRGVKGQPDHQVCLTITYLPGALKHFGGDGRNVGVPGSVYRRVSSVLRYARPPFALHRRAPYDLYHPTILKSGTRPAQTRSTIPPRIRSIEILKSVAEVWKVSGANFWGKFLGKMGQPPRLPFDVHPGISKR